MTLLTVEELVRYIELGKYPPVIYCEKKYEGICCMLKLVKNNTVFLDYDDTYDDSESEGAFRATFKFDSFDKMIAAIEKFTHKSICELTINPYCYDLFDCIEPKWDDFKLDLYNGKIGMMDNYDDFFIGDFYWDGLFQKKIKPDASTDEILEWINLRQNSD